MLRRKTLGWFALATLAALFPVGACGSDGTKPAETPPVPDLLAHCSFETPKVHEAKPANMPTEIMAGYGQAIMPMPIGTPIGGYASRAIGLFGAKPVDARPRRFGKSLVPTVGIHDAPRAEALALSAGGEKLVIIRVDSPLLNENTLFDLESKIAPDGSMRGHVVITASHSHAAWAGYQPSFVLMPGVDRPKLALAERAIEAMADAAKQAMDSMEAAKLGIAVEKNFDPGNEINHDRRGDNDTILGPDGNTAGKGKDPNLWVLRVDKLNGTPIAALVDFPIHGTVGDGDNPLVSTDAPGAIGRALSLELGYPVMHLQGAAGDVSPSGTEGRTACMDSIHCLDMPRLETLGSRAAEIIAPFVTSVQTGEKAALEIVTRTFFVNRDAVVKRPDGTELRYSPYTADEIEPDLVIFDENGKIKSPIDEFNTFAGAGLCGEATGTGAIRPLPFVAGLRPYGSCLEVARGGELIFGLFEVEPGLVPTPLCDTVRATSTAIRFTGTPTGDWLVVTAPGEPVAPFAAYLRGRSPAGADKTLLIGYAQDHVGYLLTGEDWLAGGYEPSINIWGPLEGEIIIDGILESANLAWTPEIEDPEVGSSRYMDWKYPDTDPITPITTTDHGTVAQASPTLFWPDAKAADVTILAPTVPRAVGAARFAFYGGDPAVDMPVVTIEKQAALGIYQPLTDQKGRPMSSYDGLIVTTYSPDPLDAAEPAHHVYTATWQPVPSDRYSAAKPELPFSLPLGNYRFRVKGKAKTASGEMPYELTSDPFEVIAAPLSPQSSATRNGSSIDLAADLGVAPGLRALRVGPSDSGVPLLGPWTVTVSYANGPATTVDVMPDGTGKASIPLTMQQVQDATSVEILDVAGNGGTLLVP